MSEPQNNSNSSKRNGSGLIRMVVLLAVGLMMGVAVTHALSPPTHFTRAVSTIKPKTTLYRQVSETGPQDDKEGALSKSVGQPPAWVTKGSYIDEETQAEFVLVSSDVLLRQREAEEELEERLILAVREKIDDLFVPDAGKAIGVDLHYIRTHLLQSAEECDSNGFYTQLRRWAVSEENLNKVDSPERDAFQCYARICFDKEFESWARTQWENQLVVSRTKQIALFIMATMSVLALLFGYFTAEHKTRGFYSRRLQTVGIGLLVVVGLVIWWLATSFAWL